MKAMKYVKKMSVAVLAVLFVIPFVMTAVYGFEGTHFFDLDGAFTEESARHFDDYLHSASEDLGFHIAVVMTNQSFGSMNGAQRFTNNFYDRHIGSTTKGALLMINTYDVKGQIYDYIATHNLISDRQIDSILDSMGRDLDDQNFSGAIQTFVNRIARYANSGQIHGKFYLDSTAITVMLIINVIIVGAIVLHVMSTYKLKPASCATTYLDQNSVRYTQKSDTYIRTTVTKVRNSSSSSGGGGGGGRSGGGRGR